VGLTGALASHPITQGGGLGTQVSGVVGMTQSGALGAQVSGVVGVVQSGAFTVQVSGANAGAPVWVTSSVSGVVWIGLTGALASHPITQGGGLGTQVSGIVGVTQSGALGAQVSGVVGVVQSGALAAQVSGNVSASVSGVVGILQSGALAAAVSGVIGATQSGAWSVQVSNSYNVPVWMTASQGSPVWITGTVTTAGGTGGGAVTQGGAWTSLISGVYNAPLWVTGNVANPIWVATTGGFGGGVQYGTGTTTPYTGTLMLANQGGTAVAVSASGGALLVAITGAMSAVLSGNMTMVQGGPLAVQASGAYNAPVYVATTGTIGVKQLQSSSPTVTTVAGNASNVTLLASNANRLGATIFNDSVASLYVKFGATASVTSFTIRMSSGSYYELPFNYTGQIDGIWSAATGSARITEIT
jgi:hypothetical protein